MMFPNSAKTLIWLSLQDCEHSYLFKKCCTMLPLSFPLSYHFRWPWLNVLTMTFSRSQRHWKGQNESYNFLVSFDLIDSLRHICLFCPFPSNMLCQADTLRNQDVSLVVCMYLVFFACRGGVIAGNSGLCRCGPAFNMWRQLFERNYFPLFVDSHEDTNTWLVCFFRKRTSGEKYQFCFQREGIVFSLCLCLSGCP